MSAMMSNQNLARLKQLADMKQGDLMPDWLPVDHWAEPLGEVLQTAVREIEYWRDRNLK
jgi:hypothetical protein